MYAPHCILLLVLAKTLCIKSVGGAEIASSRRNWGNGGGVEEGGVLEEAKVAVQELMDQFELDVFRVREIMCV